MRAEIVYTNFLVQNSIKEWVQSIFSSKNHSKIYTLQNQDMALLNAMKAIVVNLESDISILKNVLQDENITAKDSAVAELNNKFMLLRSKVEKIRSHVKEIISIEVQNKDFVLLNDEDYLSDKSDNLERISYYLDQLIDLLSSKPTSEELKNEYVQYINNKVMYVIEGMNNVIRDDKHLESIYARIDEL